MKLLRAGEVPETARDSLFRYSRVRAVVGFLLLAVLTAALILFGAPGGSLLAYYGAGVLVIVAIVFSRLLIARFHAFNWLVRMTDDGLFIKFRSYLNCHFTADNPTVVFIPYSDMRSARLVRQRQEIRNEHERSTEVWVKSLVELELACDTRALKQALMEERQGSGPKASRWYGSTSIVYRHYPVTVLDNHRLQLEWGVVPRAETFVQSLSRHTQVMAPAEELKDYGSRQKLSPEQKEKAYWNSPRPAERSRRCV